MLPAHTVRWHTFNNRQDGSARFASKLAKKGELSSNSRTLGCAGRQQHIAIHGFWWVPTQTDMQHAMWMHSIMQRAVMRGRPTHMVSCVVVMVVVVVVVVAVVAMVVAVVATPVVVAVVMKA